jgi:hypothetical protein
MNWINKIQDIKKQLKSSGFENLGIEVEEAQMVLGTQGEMFLSVVTKLREIKQNHKDAYSLIKDNVEEIFTYGKSINYLSGDY